MAWDELTIDTIGKLEAVSLAAGTWWTSPVKLYDGLTTHAFQYKVAGAGTVTITPYTSITGQNWVSGGAKLSGAGATTGPDSDGLGTVPMSINPGEFIKFKVVVASAAVTLTLEFVQK